MRSHRCALGPSAVSIGPAIGFTVLWAVGLAWWVIAAGSSAAVNVGDLLPFADLAASAYLVWALLTGRRPRVDAAPVQTSGVPPGRR